MFKELEDLGLGEKEAKVYLAALEIGRATADQLAKHAKIVRPTTYVQIKSLMAKGLMSTFEEGKKTFFAPESPEALRRVLDLQKEKIRTREDELARLLPGLAQMFASAGERPVVRFFPGKEGVRATREEVLATQDKEIFIIFSPEKLSALFGEDYLEEYSAKRKSLRIHSKGIYTYKDTFDPAMLDEWTERKILPRGALPLTVDIFIFDDKVAVLSLEGTLFGLVIQSKQICLSMKAIFDLLWSQAK